MPGQERISPALAIIPVGIGLALAVGLAALAWAAPPEPPPGRANLYGKVTDAVTGYPLLGVRVAIGDDYVIFTDASGNYGFTGLTPGAYTIQFSKDGYETLVR